MILLKLADDRYAIKWDDGDHSFISKRDITFLEDGTAQVKHYGGKATFVFDKEGHYVDEFYGDDPASSIEPQNVS